MGTQHQYHAQDACSTRQCLCAMSCQVTRRQKQTDYVLGERLQTRTDREPKTPLRISSVRSCVKVRQHVETIAARGAHVQTCHEIFGDGWVSTILRHEIRNAIAHARLADVTVAGLAKQCSCTFGNFGVLGIRLALDLGLY